MNVAELLQCQSMKSPRVLVQGREFYAPITGINVLEALDIDLWGRHGMVLLSSYFALRGLKSDDLGAFLRLVEEIGISALVIKVQRLIDHIPENIVNECENRQITLIEIGMNSSYQDILLDVFRPVIEQTEAQLALHYRLSNISSQLSLSLASLDEILTTFQEFLSLDCTLMEMPTERISSTTPEIASRLQLGQPLPIRRSEYMNFTYRRFTCNYDQTTSFNDSVLSVDISCIDDRQHTLIVHEIRDHQVESSDIVIIENLIRSLQTLILRQHSSRQQQQMNRNALIGDLLSGMIAQRSYRDEALRAAGLSADTPTQVLTIFPSLSTLEPSLRTSNIFRLLTRYLRGLFPNSLFYLSPNRVQLILHGNDLNYSTNMPGNLANRIDRMLEQEFLGDQVQFVGGLSDVGLADQLPQQEMQSRTTARFFRQNGKWSHIGSFDSLGALKLFVLADSSDLVAFVPQELSALYRDDRDAYDTLRLYLRHNYSHTAAARELHVHAKTVQYRINRIGQLLQMDLHDPQTQSVLLMAFEILTFLEGTAGAVTVDAAIH
ncbi:MAG: helix-turn-helix domain-containing protein [Thermomicrobiales bacterium]|nr:helix-turn-helix domain-containing protein [Thermomicrobiales bacterium]